MRDALKPFFFRRKKSTREKEFSFYQILLEILFFNGKISVKNLYELQFPRFLNENIVYLAFKFVLNKNQSGWLTTSHSAELYF